MISLPPLVSFPADDTSIDILTAELAFNGTEEALAKMLWARSLPPLVKPECLPYLFGVSHRLIGLMETQPRRFYRVYRVVRCSGGFREIEAPRRFLKVIQTWIYENICLRADLPQCVMGFVRGRSIFDNGRAHSTNRNLMVIDIENFFPSISFPKVEAVFKGFDFPNRVAHQLAALCCLDHRLPQGAPTSPAIANLVFRPVDGELLKLAREWGATYTRYADDLAFSGSTRFSKAHISQVQRILDQHGFCINEKKTRIVGQGGRQILAGLIVNQNALPPRATRRMWRAMFYQANQHPRKFTERVPRMFGIAAFVKQFAPEVAENYREIAQRVLELSR